MKKILLFCFLVGGLGSISAKTSIPEDASSALCEVKVYHMGVYKGSFFGATCGDAWHAACQYVKANGGTCPIGY